MLNKTKGFLFKELFHVWEENGFSPLILVRSMGVERVGVSSHCTRPSTGRTSCGVMGRVSHAPFLFCRAVKAGEPDKIKVWFPKQQTDLSNVCQVFTSPFTVKSTPAKNCPPLQGSRMQGDEGLGFQYPLQGHTPSDAKQRLLTLELFAFFQDDFHSALPEILNSEEIPNQILSVKFSFFGFAETTTSGDLQIITEHIYWFCSLTNTSLYVFVRFHF